MRRPRKVILVLTLCGFAAVVAATSAVPGLRWRAQVVGLKLGGNLDAVSYRELLEMIAPGSGYYLQPLVETHNPYSTIENPFQTSQDIEQGKRLFSTHCATCHGPGGHGGAAPDVATGVRRRGDSDWAVFRVIRHGVPNTPMPAHAFESRQVWGLVAYLSQLRATHASAATASPLAQISSVTAERLMSSGSDPANWLTYSGSYDGQRYSSLEQVNRSNAGHVTVKWIHQLSGDHEIHSSSPIVVDGVMYVVETPNTVHALDARDGTLLWTYSHQNEQPLSHCCSLVNRGVAINDKTLFMGTMDNHLIALDAETGRERWKVKLADHTLGVTISAAPLVVGDKVIVGFGGGEFGFRGFLDAVSISNGERIWRFHTIPGPGEAGNESWSGDSWKRGGGGTWLTGSFDPELNLLYWGVGNPGPDHQGDYRLGDNLFSNSVIALDADSGELKWYFQFTPHDEQDWDANQIPVLVDSEFRGQQRKLMLWANRNGFFYVLDRATGEYLLGAEFVKQNWARGLDQKGRPLFIEEAKPNAEGRATYPSPLGATNWQSPAFSPRTGLMYVSTLEWGQIVFKDVRPAPYTPGKVYLGGGYRPIPGEEKLTTGVVALDPKTGQARWWYRNPSRIGFWRTGGVVSTAGDVIFGGDDSRLYILDALNGSQLWQINIGGRVSASPIAFSVNGQQRFAILAGRSIVAVGLP